MLAERVTEWTQKWKMEGQSTLLSRLITRKFGENVFKLSVQERLQKATPEQLDIWTDRILEAKTIDELFSSN